jgi:hypothetical protein
MEYAFQAEGSQHALSNIKNGIAIDRSRVLFHQAAASVLTASRASIAASVLTQ